MSSAASELDGLTGLVGAKALAKAVARGGSAVSALLLYGADGSGKSAVARYIVASWMCTRPLPDGPCGECPVCRTLAAERCVDFQFVGPYGAGGYVRLGSMHAVSPHDGFGGVPILEFFRTMPLMARHKVVWIDPADRLTNDAANAFLKTLEELPAYAKVIMTTDRPGSVLPTVRSRCLAVACEVPALDQGVGPVVAAFALSPGDVARIEKDQSRFQDLFDLIQSLDSKAPASALRVSEEWRKLAERSAEADGGKARSANVAFLADLAQGMGRIHPDRPEWVIAASEAARLIEANGNANLVFDDLAVKVLSRRG